MYITVMWFLYIEHKLFMNHVHIEAGIKSEASEQSANFLYITVA